MNDMFLKLIREELSSKTLARLTQAKLVEYRGYIHSLLSSLIKSPESSIFIEKIIDYARRDAELWARFRFAKSILGAEGPSETVDSVVLETLSNLMNTFVSFIDGLNISYGSEILVRFSKDVSLPRGSRKKGDYEFVKIDDLMYLLRDHVYDTIPYLTIEFLKKHVEPRQDQR